MREERVSERVVEQIVGVPVLQIQERDAEVPVVSPQVRVQRRTGKVFAVPQIQQIVEVRRVDQQEGVSHRVVVQIPVDVPAPSSADVGANEEFTTADQE